MFKQFTHCNCRAVVDRLIETTMENVLCEVIPGALTAVP
jgi:hypothetical protein